MRKSLRKINGQRIRFRAIFERFGQKNGYMGPEKTILLKDVRILETNAIATDHLWFACGKTFGRMGLKPGDHIAFDARVGQYEKGYQGRKAERTGEAWSETDYHLQRPTKAVKMPMAEQLPITTPTITKERS